MSNSKIMEEELRELQEHLAWRKVQKAAEAEVARQRAMKEVEWKPAEEAASKKAMEEAERKAAEDARHMEELWAKAEAEQWIWRAEEEARMVAEVESAEMAKEVEWILCCKMMVKDAEKQKLQEHAVTIHKAQQDFANMKARRTWEEAKQVGLGTLEATRSSLVDSFPGDYQVVMPEASGSSRVACKQCRRWGDDCVWPSRGRGMSCTKCVDRKVRCVLWTMDRDREPSEVSKDDGEDVMPKKGCLGLSKGKRKAIEDSEEVEGI